MSKIIPLFESSEELALRLKIPKIGNYYDWFALPWDVFISWFKWKDNEEEKRLYFVYEPPIDKLTATYEYHYSLKYHILKKLPEAKDHIVKDQIDYCNFGLLVGSQYRNKIISPKKGIFVNIIDLERFRTSPYKAILKKGEIAFYIDYSNN